MSCRDDEGSDARVEEDVVERLVQVDGPVLVRGEDGVRRARVLKDRLRPLVVRRVPALSVPVEPHRGLVVRRVALPRAGARKRGVGPAREDARELLDGLLLVGRDGAALHVQLRRPVLVQHVDADREELEELAGVVLVRRDVLRRNGRRVVDHVEVVAHRRAERQVGEKRPVVPERVPVEHVQVRAHRAGLADARHPRRRGSRGGRGRPAGAADPLPSARSGRSGPGAGTSCSCRARRSPGSPQGSRPAGCPASPEGRGTRTPGPRAAPRGTARSRPPRRGRSARPSAPSSPARGSGRRRRSKDGAATPPFRRHSIQRVPRRPRRRPRGVRRVPERPIPTTVGCGSHRDSGAGPRATAYSMAAPPESREYQSGREWS